MSLLSVAGVGKKDEKGFALKNIRFTQSSNQKIALAGETGSGKSTLLKLIAGLEQPDEGDILFESVRIKGPYEKLIPGHPRIAYLSQSYELRHHYTVEEILVQANQLRGEEALRIYKVCRIHHLLQRKSNQLSGGEQQRVALARLLVSFPKLLLLDEPFSNLDAIHKSILKEVIHDIGVELNISCILVSHDAGDTLSWADEILVLKDGSIVQKAPPQQIYGQPATEYVAGLFGAFTIIQPRLAQLLVGKAANPDSKKKLLIRPEQLALVGKEGGIRGEVKDSLYYGSYCQIKVLVQGQLVTVSSGYPVSKGEIIYLSFSGQPWLVD